jgi:hypothetical protein
MVCHPEEWRSAYFHAVNRRDLMRQKNSIQTKHHGGNFEPKIGLTGAYPLPYWSLGLAPGERYVLADGIDPGVLVVQNDGPGKICVDTKYYEATPLNPGQVRIVRVFDAIFIESVDENSTVVEFEFVTTPK